MFEFIKSYSVQLSTVVAALAFVFSVYKFWSERKMKQFWQEYEAYHKLVKELVEPPTEGGSMYVDRQTAALYELRFYKRYFPHSLRMLKSLKVKWSKVPNQFPRLIEELDLTIDFLESAL
ncbi:TPA: hypothetical protein ACN30O_004542 [Vibrio parahaemolyticus]